MRRKRSTNGFTLVELLVVVAIIGLLLGILIPGLSRAREEARTVGCRSNLHQMGVQWMMVVEERGGKLPYTRHAHLSPSWDDVLNAGFEHVPDLDAHARDEQSNLQSFNACPTVQARPQVIRYEGPNTWGYAVNVGWSDDPSEYNQLRHWSAVPSPSAYPMFVDTEVYFQTDRWKANHYVPRKPSGQRFSLYGVGLHHGGGASANVAWLDGSSGAADEQEIRLGAAPDGNGPMPFFQAVDR